MNISPIVRFVGFLLLVVAAVTVVVALAPSLKHVDNGGQIAAAIAVDGVNAGATSSAPQQQVANGWVARDLLEIQVRQNDQLAATIQDSSDVRPTWLLLIGVLALCWLGLTGIAGTAAAEDVASDESDLVGDPNVIG